MHRVTPLALLLMLSLYAAAESKTLHVPAEYATLAAAVEAAAAGDTIALAAGQYPLTAPLLITKPLQISGEAADTTVIQTALAKDEMIKVDKVERFHIEKVALEYAGPPQPEGRTDFPSLLSVFGGHAEVTECMFRRSSGFGIIVKQGANATVSHCRAEDNVMAGIYVKEADTSAMVVDNTATRNGTEGIMVFDGATATIERNRCTENGNNGIIVTRSSSVESAVQDNICDKNGRNGIRIGVESTAAVARNRCHDNALAGIVMDTGSRGSATGNICVGGEHGLIINSSGTEATVEQNDCSESSKAGMGVYFGVKAALHDNNCSRNKGVGIWVSNWETTAELLGNHCNGNQASGIGVTQGAHATVRGNECVGNAGYGITVADEESDADIGENNFKDNTKGENRTTAGISGRRQFQVSVYEVGTAFMRGQFAYLEQIATRLRKYRSRYADGNWQLYWFYDGLMHGNDGFTIRKRPDYRIALEKWANEFPDSCTPRIALAMTHVEYAWEARGEGWSYEITPDRMKGFEEHLATAEKWCAEAEAKSGKDPYLYSTWIRIAFNSCAPRSRVESLLDKGMQADPSCLMLYSTVSQSLWPRWGGSREKIRQFFLTVHDRTKEEMGEKMYALVADSQFCPGAVYGDSADWSLVKPGFDQILEEFPQAWFYLNRYCLLACVFGDKEKARELFGRIGDNPNYDAWVYKEENFRKGKRWALSDGPRPDFFRVEGYPPGNTDEHVSSPFPALNAILGVSRKQIAIGLLVAGLAMALLTVLVIFLIVHLSRKRT